MKSSRQLLLVSLAVALIFTSCTMEKRVHMPGYHTEWKKSKLNPSSQQFDSNDRMVINPTAIIEQSEIDTTTIDNSFSPTVAEDNTSASVDNNPDFTPYQKKVGLVNTVTIKTNPTSETTTLVSDKNALKKKLKEFKRNRSSRDSITSSANSSNGDSGALRTIGWIVLSLGILILLFVSIGIGAVLMLLGLIFVIAGANRGGGSSKESDKSEYVDVVYLNNGSVIRGMIVEQIPNVSIKIQTKDGSIFVYKMEEVEKMTKELSR